MAMEKPYFTETMPLGNQEEDIALSWAIDLEQYEDEPDNRLGFHMERADSMS